MTVEDCDAGVYDFDWWVEDEVNFAGAEYRGFSCQMNNEDAAWFDVMLNGRYSTVQLSAGIDEGVNPEERVSASDGSVVFRFLDVKGEERAGLHPEITVQFGLPQTIEFTVQGVIRLRIVAIASDHLVTAAVFDRTAYP